MLHSPCSPAANFLQSQPWHASLAPEEQLRVLERLTLVEGGKGDCLLPLGAQVQGWYAVLSGLVKLQSASAEGRVQAFLGVPAGEWFGEGSALKAERRRYDVIALRDTTLLCLPLPVFEALRQSSLAFNQYLVAHLNRRLGQAMALIEAERLRSAEERVALYLSRVFWPGARRLSLSQEELGHLTGLSRQTVNRVLGQMARQGLVSLKFGRVDILDEPALLGHEAGKSPGAPKPVGGRGQ
ncbi:Crp/Fnr family transcriptional regulator [Ramlibacter sp. 2FC]|uniref:Crp/Fnr family transcriptional regulator n=1 Tax=Ramlibacter sp. 2FC TaxID=2502188 RepID=UPI0010FA5DFB|nr:Crp/Fnr family transcriptional regulator [Ramlibacter sp. 2FC]